MSGFWRWKLPHRWSVKYLLTLFGASLLRFTSQWAAEWLGVKGQPQRRWLLALSGPGWEQQVLWGRSCKEEVRLRRVFVCVKVKRFLILFVSHWVVSFVEPKSCIGVELWACRFVCKCEFIPKAAVVCEVASVMRNFAHVTDCKCSLVVMNFLSSEG